MMMRYSILFTIFIVLIGCSGNGNGILKSIECSEINLNDPTNDNNEQIDNLLAEIVDSQQNQQQQQQPQPQPQSNQLLDSSKIIWSSMDDDRNPDRRRQHRRQRIIQLAPHQSRRFLLNQPEFIDGIDPIAQNDFYQYLADEQQQQQLQQEHSNAIKQFDYIPQPMQKRGCLKRGENCEHRTNDCCYNSSCRCNLWGSNCRCQRIGLFQKWG